MDFASMKRRELQALCKQHGLSAGGSNADLVARLASTLSGSSGEEEEAVAVGVVVGKGCLKRSGGDGSSEDAAAAKKVSFVLEEASGRKKAVEPPAGRRKRAQVDGSTEVGAAVTTTAEPPVRRSRRNAVNSGAGDVVGGDADGLGEEMVHATRKRKAREDAEHVAVDSRVEVCCRSTRLGSLAASVVWSPVIEKKRGRRRQAGDGEEQMAVEEEAVKVPVYGRTRRSGSVAVTAASPAVVESKRSRRKKGDGDLAVAADKKAPTVEVLGRTTRSRLAVDAAVLPLVLENKRGRRKTDDVCSDGVMPTIADIPRNNAPIRRSFRSRTAGVKDNAGEESQVNKEQGEEEKPARPATRRHQQLASSVDEEAEQSTVPCEGPTLRRSRRNDSKAVDLLLENTDSETSNRGRAAIDAKNLKLAEPLMRSRRNAAKSSTENDVVKEDEHLAATRRNTRSNTQKAAVNAGEASRSDNSGKTSTTEMQLVVSEPVRRSRRNSVAASLLEKKTKDTNATVTEEEFPRTKGTHIEKQPEVKEPATRRSTRSDTHKVAVNAGEALRSDSSGKTSATEMQLVVSEPVRRSRRNSVAASLLEKKTEDTDATVTEEEFPRTKGTHLETQPEVKESATRRSTRSNTHKVAVNAGEASRSDSSGKTSATEMQLVVSESARRSRRNSVAASLLEQKTEHTDATVTEEEFPRTKGTHMEKQPEVKESATRRSTRSNTHKVAVNAGEASRSDSSGKTSATEMQLVVSESARRSRRNSVAASLLEKKTEDTDATVTEEEFPRTKSTHMEKQPEVKESATRRSTRSNTHKVAVNAGEASRSDSSGKTSATEMQLVVSESARRSRRNSVAASLLEKKTKDTDAAVTEEEFPRTKGAQIEKQPEVKESVRRSRRKSATPAMLEKENKGLRAEKKAEVDEPVRRSMRKSVLPNVFDKENKDHGEMVGREELGIQVRNSRARIQGSEPEVVVDASEIQPQAGMVAQNYRAFRRSTRQSSKHNLSDGKNAPPSANKCLSHGIVGEENMKSRKRRATEISSSVKEILDTDIIQGQKSRNQQKAHTPKKKGSEEGNHEKLERSQQQSKHTASKGRPAKRRRTTASEEVMPVEKPKVDDMVTGEAAQEENKAIHHHSKESCTRIHGITQDGCTEEEFSSVPLLEVLSKETCIVPNANEELHVPEASDVEQSGHSEDKSHSIATESKHKCTQTHVLDDIQTGNAYLSEERFGALDQSSIIESALHTSIAVASEIKALVDDDANKADLESAADIQSINADSFEDGSGALNKSGQEVPSATAVVILETESQVDEGASKTATESTVDIQDVSLGLSEEFLGALDKSPTIEEAVPCNEGIHNDPWVDDSSNKSEMKSTEDMQNDPWVDDSSNKSEMKSTEDIQNDNIDDCLGNLSKSGTITEDAPSSNLVGVSDNDTAADVDAEDVGMKNTDAPRSPLEATSQETECSDDQPTKTLEASLLESHPNYLQSVDAGTEKQSDEGGVAEAASLIGFQCDDNDATVTAEEAVAFPVVCELFDANSDGAGLGGGGGRAIVNTPSPEDDIGDHEEFVLSLIHSSEEARKMERFSCIQTTVADRGLAESPLPYNSSEKHRNHIASPGNADVEIVSSAAFDDSSKTSDAASQLGKVTETFTASPTPDTAVPFDDSAGSAKICEVEPESAERKGLQCAVTDESPYAVQFDFSSGDHEEQFRTASPSAEQMIVSGEANTYDSTEKTISDINVSDGFHTECLEDNCEHMHGKLADALSEKIGSVLMDSISCPSFVADLGLSLQSGDQGVKHQAVDAELYVSSVMENAHQEETSRTACDVPENFDDVPTGITACGDLLQERNDADTKYCSNESSTPADGLDIQGTSKLDDSPLQKGHFDVGITLTKYEDLEVLGEDQGTSSESLINHATFKESNAMDVVKAVELKCTQESLLEEAVQGQQVFSIETERSIKLSKEKSGTVHNLGEPTLQENLGLTGMLSSQSLPCKGTDLNAHASCKEETIKHPDNKEYDEDKYSEENAIGCIIEKDELQHGQDSSQTTENAARVVSPNANVLMQSDHVKEVALDYIYQFFKHASSVNPMASGSGVNPHQSIYASKRDESDNSPEVGTDAVAEESIQETDSGKHHSNDTGENLLGTTLHAEGIVEDKNAYPPWSDAEGCLSDGRHSSFGLNALFAEESKQCYLINDESVPAKVDCEKKPIDGETASLHQESDCAHEEVDVRLVRDKGDKKLDVEQDDVREGTLSNPKVGLATPESTCQCGLSEEAVHLTKNDVEECSSKPKLSPFGLQSLFSQESMDESMVQGALSFARVNAEKRPDESNDCLVECGVEKTVLSENDSDHGPHEVGVDENGDCMFYSLQDDEKEGLLKSGNNEVGVVSAPSDLSESINYMERETIPEEVACVEENRMLVSSSDANASGDELSINGSGCHNFQLLHQGFKEQYNDKIKDLVTSAAPRSDMAEAATVEEFESGMTLLPAEEAVALPDEQLNSMLEGKEVEECELSRDNNLSDIFETDSLENSISNSTPSNLPKDTRMDSFQQKEPQNDLSTSISPEESAISRQHNGSGICQTSGRRRIDEMSSKLLSFRISSATKGNSYVATNGIANKQGDNLGQSAIASLRDKENTPANKTDHPLKQNLDRMIAKDSSRRPLQTISRSKMEH